MNELVIAGRSLMALDDGMAVIDASLDQQLMQIDEEIDNVDSKIEGIDKSIANALNVLCFRYPELSKRFREKYNKLLELKGELPISAELDPATRRDKEGNDPATEAIKAEREAEEEARRAIEELSDSDLTPKMRQAKLAVRIKREKCRKFYLKIAQKTHPDKVKDKDLNEVFIKAKKAYDNLDVDLLRTMFKDLQGFLKLRGKKSSYRSYLFRRLQISREYLADRKVDLRRLTSSSAHDCLSAMQKGDSLLIRETYQDYVEEQLIKLDDAIDSIQQRLRIERSKRMSKFSLDDVFTFNDT